ncbi:Major facilitator superfamily transporter phthalate permease [Pseudomonas syringae pv. cerasicola]|uniref:Major facilitator superfamily transporter phthalate permease n=1 Tax=Pseudomonas syringae pv. cerasicola TaxID=264451 RepID=A0A0P9M5Z0_PSESX|nr:Major facilitator superfamily transporter phthalate permease [Pseudomonas syringae pv. cerasicola]
MVDGGAGNSWPGRQLPCTQHAVRRSADAHERTEHFHRAVRAHRRRLAAVLRHHAAGGGLHYRRHRHQNGFCDFCHCLVGCLRCRSVRNRLAEHGHLPWPARADRSSGPAGRRQGHDRMVSGQGAFGCHRLVQHCGALLAPPLVVWAILQSGWELAFLIVGGLGIVWSGLWLLLYKHPRDQKRLGDAERDYILSGQESRLKDAPAQKGSWKRLFKNRNFYAIASARILSEPAWQTFNAWIPLYLMTERHMNIKEVAMFAWLPFLAADIGCVLGGYLSPLFHKYCKVSLFTSRKMVMLFGCSCMIGPACIGLVESPYTAIALLCIGGFAHQTLSGALYSITSDSFGKNEVATATGMGGMFGFFGAAAFTMVFGVLVTKIGYSPLFVVLAIFDIVAAIVVWTVAREVPQNDEAVALSVDESGSRTVPAT